MKTKPPAAVNRILSSGKGIVFVVDRDKKLKGVIRTADLIRHYSKALQPVGEDRGSDSA